MRLLTSLRTRAAERTMLEIERARHQPARGFAYVAAGAVAVVLVTIWAMDANGMAITQRPTTQRATVW
jgi:hypothetical protein